MESDYFVPWTRATESVLGTGALLRRFNDTISTLKRLGAPPPGSGRIANAYRVFVEIAKAKEATVPDSMRQRQLRDSLKTLWEFYIITKAAERYRNTNTPFTKERLIAAQKGSDLESEDSNQHGRNTQFELLTAALFVHGGCEVTLDEPDLHLFYGGQYVGLAVKRLRSLNERTIRARILEGVRQIERAKRLGFVVLNLDSRFAEISPATPDEQRAEAYSDALKLIRDILLSDVRDRWRCIGVISIANSVGWDLPQDAIPMITTSYPMYHHLLPEADLDAQQGYEFFRGFHGRLRNAMRGLAE